MTITGPNPFLTWGGEREDPIRHIVMSDNLRQNSPAVIASLDMRVSSDGLQYRKIDVGGDLRLAYKNINGPQGLGAFFPSKMLKINSRFVLVGTIYVGNAQRGAIFTTADSALRKWEHVPTSIDQTTTNVDIVDIAANGSYVVALANSGERAVSTDGGATFTGYQNIGFSLPANGPANAIAASNSGFVAGGNNGQMFSTNDPRAPWTARNAQFAGSNINAIVAGNVFCAIGSAGKISTAALTDVATWTARNSGVSDALSFLAYGNKWFVGGSSSWLESAAATSGWSTPVNKPGGADYEVPQSGYYANGVWRVFPRGKLQVGDGSTWQTVVRPNLKPNNYSVSLAA